MKILLYTDNHFCTNSSIINSRGENYSTRLTNQIESLNWVEQLAIKENCNIEICLGDFFNNPTLTAEELSALREINWNHLEKEFIVGNHEMGNNDLSYNSLNALSNIGNIVTKPTLIADDYCNIILIPYILESNRKSLKEYINEAFENTQENYNAELPLVILTHNDIKGIQYGGFLSKAGFDIEEINGLNGIFIDGHLHNKETYGLVIPKVFILGNLTGLNFGENAFEYSHNAYILDTENLQLKTVENPYAFKFFKFDILLEEDLEKYKNFFQPNSVVSIKVLQSLSEKVKEFVYSNKNIIKSRITIIPEISNTQDNTVIISKDHIQQFKEYILENVGCDDIIQEELGRL